MEFIPSTEMKCHKSVSSTNYCVSVNSMLFVQVWWAVFSARQHCVL